jgi:hypothetical protein
MWELIGMFVRQMVCNDNPEYEERTMRTMASVMLIAALASLIAAAGIFRDGATDADRVGPIDNIVNVSDDDGARHVDMAICLDTSGSMDGLIQSAKQKLWAVVNELATARPRPVLRVALYHYGNSSLNSEDGWVKQLCPLTTDLDLVYEKLFELTTNGGTEYVARVMHAATTQLKWDKSKGTLRMIFVAGNEAATQDTRYKLRNTCKAAATAGVIVNTVHCGDEVTGRNGGWADAAAWADGRYAAIDQNGGTIVIQTMHDKELAKLSSKLNKTYVRYGKNGKSSSERQFAQDANAKKLGVAAAAVRAMAKSTPLYDNARWDLVDASKRKGFDIRKIPNAALPAVMQKMNNADKMKYIATQAGSRRGLQQKIKALSGKRDQAVKAEKTRRGLDGKSAFGVQLKAMVREQAEKQDFKFEE